MIFAYQRGSLDLSLNESRDNGDQASNSSLYDWFLPYWNLSVGMNIAGDDYAGDTSTTGTVSIGGSTPGNIEVVGDTDWFRITLIAGHTYRFDLQAHDSSHGSLPDPHLGLRDSVSNLITFDDDSGTGLDSQITYIATTSGTYYLSAGSVGTGTGTYLVSATEAPSGLGFSFNYGTGVPDAAKAVVEAVAAYLSSQFTDPITLNISVNWGAIGGLGPSSYNLFTYSYDEIKNALMTDSKSSDDAAAVLSIPLTDPIAGSHTWTMTQAQARALSLSGFFSSSDGSVTFSNTFDIFDFDRSNGITPGQYDFYGVVAHELTEVMGRELNAIGNNVATGGRLSSVHPLDLFKYSSFDSHIFVGASAGYFSLDNGLRKH